MIEGRKENSPVAPRQAVQFLLYNDNSFLLERNIDPRSSYEGQIKPLSGKIESEETDAEAVFREVKEELGVKASSIVYLRSFSDSMPRGEEYLVHSYLVISHEGEIKNSEPGKRELVRLGYKQAISVFKSEEDKKTVKQAQEFINEEEQRVG